MPFTVSGRVSRDLRRFRNHMCASPTQIPCLAYGRVRQDGEDVAPQFVLGAMNRQLCKLVGNCKIVDLADMDVAVIAPESFDLLDSVRLDYVEGRIVNVD